MDLGGSRSSDDQPSGMDELPKTKGRGKAREAWVPREWKGGASGEAKKRTAGTSEVRIARTMLLQMLTNSRRSRKTGKSYLPWLFLRQTLLVRKWLLRAQI